MSNLLKRIITAAVILPPFLAIVMLAKPVHMAIAAVIICLRAGYEFADITFDKRFSRHRFLASSLSATVAAGIALYPVSSMIPLFVLITAAPFSLLVFMFSAKDLKTAITTSALCTLGVFYTGGLFGAAALIPFSDGENGRWWTLLLMCSTILNDTFAYSAGRIAGKRKLNKRLSPNKTVEGSLGGVIGSLTAVTGVKYIYLVDFNIYHAVAMGIVLGIVSQLGDLMESFIKRSFTVKDAGSIFPGHGGVLDRFDSFLLGAPVVLLYAWFN